MNKIYLVQAAGSKTYTAHDTIQDAVICGPNEFAVYEADLKVMGVFRRTKTAVKSAVKVTKPTKKAKKLYY